MSGNHIPDPRFSDAPAVAFGTFMNDALHRSRDFFGEESIPPLNGAAECPYHNAGEEVNLEEAAVGSGKGTRYAVSAEAISALWPRIRSWIDRNHDVCGLGRRDQSQGESAELIPVKRSDLDALLDQAPTLFKAVWDIESLTSAVFQFHAHEFLNDAPSNGEPQTELFKKYNRAMNTPFPFPKVHSPDSHLGLGVTTSESVFFGLLYVSLQRLIDFANSDNHTNREASRELLSSGEKLDKFINSSLAYALSFANLHIDTMSDMSEAIFENKLSLLNFFTVDFSGRSPVLALTEAGEKAFGRIVTDTTKIHGPISCEHGAKEAGGADQKKREGSGIFKCPAHLAIVQVETPGTGEIKEVRVTHEIKRWIFEQYQTFIKPRIATAEWGVTSA